MRKLCFIALMLTFAANVFASDPAGDRTVNKHWTVNPHLYANNMTVVGVIELNDTEIRNEYLEIGAFSGEECRGSEVLKYYAAVDRYLLYLTVYGDDDETISFRLYDHELNYELEEATTADITFAVNAMHGMPSNPYVFDFTCPVYNVACQPNIGQAGTVSGGGTFFYGQPCSVNAAANTGFHFLRWTENGVQKSLQPNYAFNVSGTHELVAEFAWAVTDTIAENCVTFDWHGHTYNASGVYHDTVSSALGIDSLVDLHLTIHPEYHIDLYVTECEVYYWYDEPYYESGDYQASHYSAYGCDSIETLHLTILPIRLLGNFTYMSPANNYIDRYTDMDFYWDAIPNANCYDFYFWQGEGNRPNAPMVANTTAHTYQVGGLTHGTTYHWCVVAKNECQESESETRTFTCQLNPSMTVIPNGWHDFGEVDAGQTRTKTIAVSGTALTEDISYSYLDNALGQDADFFAITPSNWSPTGGGLLHVTFSPVATQLYYNTGIRIASGAFVDTLYFTGSLANRYVFTTNVDGNVFSANDEITITGHVEDVLGNPVPDMGVSVYLIVMGSRTTGTAVSDANGDYSTTYKPRYSESGYYQVGSCAYGTYSNDVHDSFDIPGMSRVSSDFIIWNPYQDDTVTGTVEIRNRSRIPISNIQINPISLPNGCSVNFTGVTNLGPLETGLLSYVVTGSQVTTSNNYEEANFVVTADNGISMNMTCYYYCRQRRGTLAVYPPSVATTMQRNTQKILSFQVTNNGNGETGPITVSLPDLDWMSMMGDATMESLQVGDSCAFSIMLAPDANVSLNQYSGSIAVNCANGNGLSIPFQIRAVADTTATVVVDVTDDYTYNTNGGNGPHLEGANVSLKGYYTLETVAQGLTDENGLFTVENVPEGWYYLTISADWHHEYSSIIKIENGSNNRQSYHEIYLQLKSHEYSWVVVPTEIEDEYEFELVCEIQTNVPIPVVVVDFPPRIDTIAYGDTLQFNIVVTNYGLVDAYETQLTVPTEFVEYDFYPLYDFIDTLHAHESVFIPCFMTRTPRNRETNPDDCVFGKGRVISWYHCNAKREWVQHTYVTKLNLFCSHSGEGNGGDGNGGGGNGGASLYDINFHHLSYEYGFNEWPTGSSGTVVTPPPPSSWLPNVTVPDSFGTHVFTIKTQDCTPCWKVIALDIVAPILQKITHVPMITIMDWIVNLGDKMEYYAETTVNGINNPKEFAYHVIGDISDLVSMFNFFDDVLNHYNYQEYEQTLINHQIQAGLSYENEWYQEYDADAYIMNSQYAQEESINNIHPHPIGNTLGIVSDIYRLIYDLSNCISFTNPNRDDADVGVLLEQLEYAMNGAQAMLNEITNLLQEEEWQEDDNVLDFLYSFGSMIDSVDYSVSSQAAQQLKDTYRSDVINDSIIQHFVDRWNRSMQYWNEGIFTLADLPSGYDNNFIQLDSTMIAPAFEAVETANAYGFLNVGNMMHSAFNRIYGKTKEHKNDVCAKISVSFKQTMTMTREAFEGTLKIFNGHPIDPMQDINVNIVIKDANGNDRTDLFQINVASLSDITGVDGTGTLEAQTEGIVQFMMIPTIEAAPDTAMYYSFGGSFSFLDPFSGTEMIYDLYPVRLQVNPSPNLHVDYFISRHIISDDPMTEDTIEATEPAEVAMMIRNVGAGDANNVYLQSVQPQIVENQNGLLIQFNMVGSTMNGEPRPLGLTDIPFGTIASNTAGIAEWYFTSSLLARVISATPHVIHNNSYGNPNLSLVTELHSHVLIKAISAYGSLEDGINDFLVDDNNDFNHTPDIIYFSHGGTTPVSKVLVASTEGTLTNTNREIQLTITPTSEGWNYACVDDPAEGEYDIVSCIRDDGQEIPLSNVWTTWATMFDEGAPIHENKLHIVDTIATGQTTTYTLIYEPSAIISQTTTLAEGWNWWSSYLDLSDGGLNSLEEALGNNAIMVKSQRNGFVTYDGGEWYGNLNTLDNRFMYRIQTNAETELSLSGLRTDLSQLTIGMVEGWNWIGYPVPVSQSVANALSGLNADNGDMLKSQTKFAVYDGDDGWFGGLHNMDPGQGYMYIGSQAHNFQYPSGRGEAETEQEEELHWRANAHAYPDNMSVVAVVVVDGEEQRADRLEVGAFSDGELVGSSPLLHNAKRDRWFAMVPVSGHGGEEVSFLLYDAVNGYEFGVESEERVGFTADGIFGSLDSPMELHFNTLTSTEEDGVAMLRIYPNPVTKGGEIRLSLPDDAGKVRVEIYNVLDVLVSAKETTGNTVRLNSSVSPGTYILKVFTETGKTYYGKLIVK